MGYYCYNMWFAGSIMMQGPNSVGSSACQKQGLIAAFAAVAITLAFVIFTHIATCTPCYDDDVCAAARIDHPIQLAIAKIVEAGSPKGKCAAVSVPRQTPTEIVLLESVADFFWKVAVTGQSGSEPSHRNSTLAHRRTVVLLV
jgi:hypothetical protein